MKYRTLEDEAVSKRQRADVLLKSAAELDDIAQVLQTPGGALIVALLERRIDHWRNNTAWGELNAEAVREQGKAILAKELLLYFGNAEEEAKRQRAEADRLIGIVETAADQGRISRV